MADNPFYQSLDPAAAPDPVTPADTPGDSSGWAEVTPSGIGGAPYDINAPQDIAGITSALTAAMGLTGGGEGTDTGAGIPDRHSPRQAEAQAFLDSPQGAGAMNVLGGFPDYENNDVSPGPDLETPIQGEMGTYPVSNTYQPGIPMFGGREGAGVEGVPPETGSMGGGAGLGYPGTTQDGLTKYGTS